MIVALKVRSHRKRMAALAAQWQAFQQHRNAGRGDLLQITRVYQRGRRGSKAVVTWCDTGRQQDAWFWNWHVPAGAYLLVNASSGYGPHSHNPNVLYVQPGQVQAWVPAQAARAAQRVG
ncbi:mS29 family ribosomal protein [Streptomyces sp. 15-116A]|uniref:mS29 family ribosomal protein n=1 Tax=Streptomyces sp. 15-116A TaxID=2259035 RepID=UPI0021B45A1E|nr:mS29 family ribosomal protein [Streptomyces sp. 15-116A]MCT7355156.1 mS29 family ribosomal protein [Streptomyces sp. 15-116A]